MAVERGEAAGMDHHHVSPVAAERARVPGARHREVVHDTAVRCMDRGAVVSRDVEAAVKVMAGTAGIVGLEGITRRSEERRVGKEWRSWEWGGEEREER